jgi:hypothetical protein
MQAFWDRIKLLIPLLAAVYLGFYVFALVMGVFAPAELLWMGAIAAVCAVGLIVYVIAIRRGISPISEDSPLQRAGREQRERRGF